MEELFRPVNEYNTPLDEKFYEGLSKEVCEDINAAIDEIIFIQRLISPHMPYLHSLERDELGRVIVDVTNPHRLTNMEFFMQAGMHYRQHGTYTNLPANRHPKSPYSLFWREERRRIKEGLVRDDGEWIPGNLYWYWNYCPIMKTRRIGKGKRSERIHDFGDIWLGDYLYWHYLDQAANLGKHGEMLKVRGIGNSFKMGSIGPRNALFKARSSTFYVANDTQYLTKDGVLTKAWDYLDFLAQHTPFPRLKTIDTKFEKRIGYKDIRTGSEKGMKADIIGLSTKDDPDKIRGKRGDIIFEEYGAYPHIKTAWAICRASVEDGENVFAQLIAGGTGGTEGADFEGAEDMFYHPDSYNIMSLQNVYDRNSNGNGLCGFFWGAYLNRANCYDQDGMPNVTKALRELFVELERIRKSASDPRAITQRKAEYPITPQDSMMRIDGTIFPVADIREHLEYLLPRLDEITGAHYVGDLVFDKDGRVIWRLNGNVKPIREFPLKDNKVEGAIEIFEMPNMVNGEAQRNRYVAGIDTFDDDASNTVSLGSIFILDLFTDRIVAEYTGRPKFANDFFEICRRMLIFYNAIGNYENDKKGLFQYFDRKNSLYLLSDTLQSLRDVEMVRGNLYGNKAHPYSQEVHTPDGVKVWGDIHVGDRLFGDNGEIVKVVDIPFDGYCDTYVVSLKDGRKIEASENHLWNVVDWNNEAKTISTIDILNDLGRKKGKYFESKYYIPSNMGASFDHLDVPIDPYFLGIMLGDGCMTQSRHHQAYFTSSMSDLKEYKKMLNMECRTHDDRHHRFLIRNIGKKFKDLGLSESESRTKFIPDIYKYNSYDVRINLLRGLMDTDGTIGYGGKPQFTTTSRNLFLDVIELSRSLGINCSGSINKNKFGDIFLVRFYTDVRVFNLERKYSKQRISKTRHYKTAITSIEKVSAKLSKCVTVDSYNGCYLIGDYVTTHNSKGTNSGRFINARARRLLADWMLTDAFGTDANGNTTTNLKKVRSVGLLLEAMKWNPNGNFDRVSSAGMLMLIREDRQKYVDNEMRSENKRFDGLQFDPYFIKNSKGTLPITYSDNRGTFEYKFDL